MSKISEFQRLKKFTGEEIVPLASKGDNFGITIADLMSSLAFKYRGELNEESELPAPAESNYGEFYVIGTHIFLFIHSTIAGEQAWVDIGDFRGPAGRDGTGINVIGPLPEVEDLPESAEKNGDAYLIKGIIYIWTGKEWSIFGQRGPEGKDAFAVWKERQSNPDEVTFEDYVEAIRGSKGEQGDIGPDGKDAFAVAQEAGYKGSRDEWLQSLHGKDGKDGTNGESAYQLAKKAGFEGDEAAWLASLVGPNGKSAYQVAVDNGFVGDETAFIASLKSPGLRAGGAVDKKEELPEVGDAEYYWMVGTNMYLWIKDAWYDAGNIKGEKGDIGPDGKSAYEIAKAGGYTGSESEWIASLKGDAGESAYQTAVKGGYKGTEAEWIQSLHGKVGETGKSAYDAAVEAGFEGTEAAWLASLHGKDGAPGYSAYELAVQKGFSGTVEEYLKSLEGDNGYKLAVQKGFKGSEEEWLASLVGKPGKDAYQLAVDKGFKGDEAAWLASLRGEAGKSAYAVAKEQGFDGTEDEWLVSLRAPGFDKIVEAADVGSLPEKGDVSTIYLVGNTMYLWTETGYKAGSEFRGPDGKSAFELAKQQGFTGTLDEWIASLKGEKGNVGPDGKSAYDIAKAGGFEGDEKAWLESLHGAKGDAGESIYQVAKRNGFQGTETQYLEAQKGESAYSIAVRQGFKGNEAEWIASLAGEAGQSAYQIAVANGFEGSIEDYLTSLVGPAGKEGPEGKQGPVGPSVPVKDYLDTESQLPGTGVEGDGYMVAGVLWIWSVEQNKFVSTGQKLKGEDGRDGTDGKDGAPGKKGADGKDGNRVIPMAARPTALDGREGDLAWVYSANELHQKVSTTRWVMLANIGGGNVYDTVEKFIHQVRLAGEWVPLPVQEAPNDGKQYVRKGKAWAEFGLDTYNLAITRVTDGNFNAAEFNCFIIDGTKQMTIKFNNLPANRAQVFVVVMEGSTGNITWPSNMKWTEERAPVMGATYTNITVMWDGTRLTASVSQKV